MVQGPPSSDSEPENPDNPDEYEYESEGEQVLSQRARELFRASSGDYRLARAALLAYTRSDLVYVSTGPPRQRGDSSLRSNTPSRNPPPSTPPRTVSPSNVTRPAPPSNVTLPASQPSTRAGSLPPPSSMNRTRFLTPPPTPAPKRTTTRNATIVHPTPQPPPQNNEVVPHAQARSRQYHPAPIVTKPQRAYYTNLYPILRDQRMRHHFPMEDGIANRPLEDVSEILSQIRLDPLWAGNVEYVDTTAFDGPNMRFKIHQPRPDAVSNRWYCVTIGTEVGVFASWPEVAPLVLGVSGAVHHHRSTKADAYRSFQYALLLGTVRLVPPP